MTTRLVVDIPGDLLLNTVENRIIDEGVLQKIAVSIDDAYSRNLEILVSIGFENLNQAIPHVALSSPKHMKDFTNALCALINGSALFQALKQLNVPTKLLANINVPFIDLEGVTNIDEAIKALSEGNVVLSTIGVEQSLFMEDFSAAARAVEIAANGIVKVVPSNLLKNLIKDKQRLSINYDEAMSGQYEIPLMKSALTYCIENRLPIFIIEFGALNSLPYINVNSEVEIMLIR